jgi:hypothetical protein
MLRADRILNRICRTLLNWCNHLRDIHTLSLRRLHYLGRRREQVGPPAVTARFQVRGEQISIVINVAASLKPWGLACPREQILLVGVGRRSLRPAGLQSAES